MGGDDNTIESTWEVQRNFGRKGHPKMKRLLLALLPIVAAGSAPVEGFAHDPTNLAFPALIDGNSHPFRMYRDGRNKVDLTKASREFAYGFSSSRDGKRIAYHKNYQAYLADADGSNARRVETGKPFNFVPT